MAQRASRRNAQPIVRRSEIVALNLRPRERSAATRMASSQNGFLLLNQVKCFAADEHFSVDGTLIEAWASQTSFRPKDGVDGDDGTNFHGQTRKNDTHASTSDPDSRLYRKAAGRGAMLCYMATLLLRTDMGCPWPAWSRTRAEPPSAAPRRKCSTPQPGKRVAALPPVRTRLMTRPIMRSIFATSTSHRMSRRTMAWQAGRWRRSAIDARTHAPSGLRHVADAPGDGRMHLRLGQAARHDAQDQTLRHLLLAADFMLNLIAYNVIRVPKLVTA